jgi:hypothetical protein
MELIMLGIAVRNQKMAAVPKVYKALVRARSA